ncbi:MAG TPA: hypothetical protein VFW07_28365 [Parafilimonas sp.]|nr:hypothetical protein [Parafilimonas sp.]
MPAEAIKNFDEERAIHNIQNNYDSAVINAGPTINYKCNFNPIDKYVEQVEENKKLYERLLQAKKEKIALLEKMLDSKK